MRESTNPAHGLKLGKVPTYGNGLHLPNKKNQPSPGNPWRETKSVTFRLDILPRVYMICIQLSRLTKTWSDVKTFYRCNCVYFFLFFLPDLHSVLLLAIWHSLKHATRLPLQQHIIKHLISRVLRTQVYFMESKPQFRHYYSNDTLTFSLWVYYEMKFIFLA